MNLKTLAVIPAAVLVLTGCGSFGHDEYEYVAFCADRHTLAPLPDYMCNSGGLYPVAAPYYVRDDRYDSVRHERRRLTGGSLKAPNPRRGQAVVRSAGDSKRVTVFEHGEQAGKPVKYTQDANRGVVTKKQKAKSSDPAWGTPPKRSKSFGNTSKSSSSKSSSFSSSKRR